MKSKFDSHFLFTVCQVGAETALKQELLREHSELRFAYSRPGFLTFKRQSQPSKDSTETFIPLDFSLKSVFSRAYGVSLGALPLKEIARISEWIEALEGIKTPTQSLWIHVWEKDMHPPGEEPLGYQPGLISAEAIQKIQELSPSYLKYFASTEMKEGDLILDFILLSSEEGWVGVHQHHSRHLPCPGGRFPVTLPPEAPSRAYLKLEESLLWSKAPIQKGDWAIEIGSAPGGASYALLQHGLNVVGIDPGAMDPIVSKNPRFKHLKKAVAAVLRNELPPQIQWIFLDMNVEPRVSLTSTKRMVEDTQSSLLGVILTIKLNQWEMAQDLPEILSYVRTMGMVRIRVTQLASHRQEIVISGLTQKGVQRVHAKTRS